MHTLEIKNLTVQIEDKTILKDFSFQMHSGEIHAIMGPNGTGKSTLSKVIMGDPTYEVTSGSILFDGNSIENISVDERAKLGLFLGMQMPVQIEGVTNADFLRTALHSKEGHQFKLLEFIKNMDQECEHLKIDKSMIHRSINDGFSGGERKKNEILQMKLLKPSIILLDEIDSGLDVDSLKIVGKNVMNYYEEKEVGILLITHYKRLLDYIPPTHIHIMMNGKIIKSGNLELVNEIEQKGYEKIMEEINSNIIEENQKYE